MTGPRQDEAGAVRPLRHLGLFGLVTIGINSVIGGGIFIMPAKVAALVGAVSLLAYVAAGVIVWGIGTVLGRLAARFDTSGGPYAYIEQAFGPVAGFLAACVFWFARTTSMANLLNGAALYLGALWPVLAGSWARAALIVAAAMVVTGLDVAGIRQASRASNVFTFLKVAPLLVVGIAGLTLVDPARLDVFGAAGAAVTGPRALVRAVLLLMYIFTGFESMIVPAEESRQPRRDMPRALLVVIACVSGIYLLVHVAALGALPDLASETAPLASLAALEFGEPGRFALTFAAGLSMTGCALASLIGGSRIFYATAAAGRIPPWFGALHPGTRTPVRASILTGGIATVLAVGGGYSYLAAVSSGTRLVLFAACCLVCLRPGGGGRVVPALTGLAILVLLWGLEPGEVLGGMIGVAFGLVLSLLAGRGQRREAREGS